MICKVPLYSLHIRDSENCKVCCHGGKRIISTPINDYSFKEYDKKYIDNVLSIVSGEDNPVCLNCSENRYESYKIMFGEEFENLVKSNLFKIMNGEQVKPVYVKLGVGANCNNNCKTCDASFYGNDTPHIDYDNKFFEYRKSCQENMPDRVYDILQEHSDTILELDLLGGETFLYPNEMLKAISICDRLKRVTITTNMSIVDDSILSHLENKNISTNMLLSIDGTYDSNKFIRGFSDYDVILKNYEHCKNTYRNINFTIAVTVSVLNFLDLDNVVNDIRKYFGSDITILINIVIDPLCYSLKVIKDLKLIDRAISIALSIDSVSNINYYISFLNILKQNIDIKIPKIEYEILHNRIRDNDNLIKLSYKDYVDSDIIDFIDDMRGGDIETSKT